MSYAVKARRNGLVSLDAELESIKDPFLKRTLTLAVDGTHPSELRQTMEMEMDREADKEELIPKVFEAAGGFAPTIGILGAVIGLIQVMQRLQNINEVGTGIAVAFVATIYGVGSANIFFLPWAGRMKMTMRRKQVLRELILDGVISIVERANPRILEAKLSVYRTRPAPAETKRAGGAMRRRRRSEENAHAERWLVSYADFMTLLFALFVVLFASSYQDKRTVQRVSSAVKNGFQNVGTYLQSDGMQENSSSNLSRIGSAASGNPGIDVAELQRKLTKALGKEIERQEVDLRMTPEGFVISLHELGFFNSGEARLLPGAADKIKRIAAVLMQYGLDMRVEGHSDNVPIHNAAFASNWDLSTARAMAVAMMLIDEAGFDPRRMSIAGYGEYHPTASNDTPEGRRANRRVDIVVVSVSKAVPAKTP